MTSEALRPARTLHKPSSVAGLLGLVALLLCLPWLISCSAANSSQAASPYLSGNLLPANVGSPYNGTISVSGGKAPYVFSLSSGSLPGGLSLSTAVLVKKKKTKKKTMKGSRY